MGTIETEGEELTINNVGRRKIRGSIVRLKSQTLNSAPFAEDVVRFQTGWTFDIMDLLRIRRMRNVARKYMENYGLPPRLATKLVSEPDGESEDCEGN